ncbi:hypothetical protein FEM48_Zijuj04G0190000 [Ziziphus jujuba var. spinosa]|uniref:Uncharacterized protein n=1 Tax=Ziziphus jujuba var. spinosa TaxID=714518 RepID=A0A978VLL8_ZIZJJ|nr:hypothetical protein FEM48_Zijuj04G0190000 [Ziziphus jujuba var. spinosa]
MWISNAMIGGSINSERTEKHKYLLSFAKSKASKRRRALLDKEPSEDRSLAFVVIIISLGTLSLMET